MWLCHRHEDKKNVSEIVNNLCLLGAKHRLCSLGYSQPFVQFGAFSSCWELNHRFIKRFPVITFRPRWFRWRVLCGSTTNELALSHVNWFQIGTNTLWARSADYVRGWVINLNSLKHQNKENWFSLWTPNGSCSGPRSSHCLDADVAMPLPGETHTPSRRAVVVWNSCSKQWEIRDRMMWLYSGSHAHVKTGPC